MKNEDLGGLNLSLALRSLGLMITSAACLRESAQPSDITLNKLIDFNEIRTFRGEPRIIHGQRWFHFLFTVTPRQSVGHE